MANRKPKQVHYKHTCVSPGAQNLPATLHDVPPDAVWVELLDGHAKELARGQGQPTGIYEALFACPECGGSVRVRSSEVYS